jgi:hypothetical protein
MWLAVDAAGPDIIAWPIDDAGTAGEPIVASTIGQLASRGTKIVVDGAADAPRRSCPVELTGLVP